MDQSIKQTIQTPRHEMLNQDLIQSRTYRNARFLLFIVCCLCLSPFYYGFTFTYISTLGPTILYQYFGPEAAEPIMNGYLIGVVAIGAAVGSLLAPAFMNYLSRKSFLLFFNGFAILICGILQINNLVVLFVCRFFQGFIIGNYMGVTPVYIKQLTPVSLRGTLGALSQFFNIGGVVFCYALGLAFQLSDVNHEFFWRFMFAFTGLTVIAQSLLLIFDVIPQSPVSYIELGRLKQARRILAIFNSSNVIDNVFVQYLKLSKRNKVIVRYRRVQRENPKAQSNKLVDASKLAIELSAHRQSTPTILKIKDQTSPVDSFKNDNDDKNILIKPSYRDSTLSRKPSSWTDYNIQVESQVRKTAQNLNIEMKQKENKIILPPKAYILGFQIPIMQPLSGVKVIITQIGSIMGLFNESLATYTPLVINFIQLIATAFSILVLTHFGRRTVLLAGNFGTAFSGLLVGIFFLAVYLTGNEQLVFGSLVFIIIFMIIYGLTIGPAVWLYVPEIVHPKIVPPATSMNWLGIAFSVMVTPVIIKAADSPYPVFFLFSILSFIFFVVNVFLVVETKGLSPSQITQKLS